MGDLIWTRNAAKDLLRMYRFLAEKNPKAAIGAAKAIQDGAAKLLSFPFIGRPVKGVETRFRELIVSFGKRGYVIRYENRAETVILLSIRHQREDQ